MTYSLEKKKKKEWRGHRYEPLEDPEWAFLQNYTREDLYSLLVKPSHPQMYLFWKDNHAPFAPKDYLIQAVHRDWTSNREGLLFRIAERNIPTIQERTQQTNQRVRQLCQIATEAVRLCEGTRIVYHPGVGGMEQIFTVIPGLRPGKLHLYDTQRDFLYICHFESKHEYFSTRVHTGIDIAIPAKPFVCAAALQTLFVSRDIIESILDMMGDEFGGSLFHYSFPQMVSEDVKEQIQWQHRLSGVFRDHGEVAIVHSKRKRKLVYDLTSQKRPRMDTL